MLILMCIELYRFFFYANENHESQHIHNEGFQSRELKQIERHLRDNIDYLIECWDSFFGGVLDDEQ